MSNNNEIDKTSKVSKSFMTIGPSLHYSHENVQRYWLLAITIFCFGCLFWSKILTGSFWSFDFQSLVFHDNWRLDRAVVTGVSIFEYPWQICVLALVMGILAIVPILISQLMSFSYSLPFLIAVVFFANLPLLAVSLLLSCIAVACRPLRFRSRFIAVALCTAPQLIYWGYFGISTGSEPIRWGFAFAPWIGAWLTCLAVSGFVIGIGHFTRYRPCLIWMVTAVVLLAAVFVFQIKIGFAELDYQLYVARNNPEQVSEFHNHSITEALDETITNPAITKYLADFFYPAEPILLREKLKKEIQEKLSAGRWPSWFIVPEKLKYEEKRQWLLERYDMFIKRRPKNRRMPIALYYKAILSEYSPDIRVLGEREIVHFYSDYPHERSRKIWYRLFAEFGRSPEAIEARWRIAMHWAGQEKFAQANELLQQAQVELNERLKILQAKQPRDETLFSLFQPPRVSVISTFKVEELQRKITSLRVLISSENKTDAPESSERLAKFIMLNPHSQNYADSLNELLSQMNSEDQIYDNVMLARTKLIADEQLRAEKLIQLHRKFESFDGGMEALYELGLLKRRLWGQQPDTNVEQKKKYLTETRDIFLKFLELYPESTFSSQVKKHLEHLPCVD